MPRKGEPKPQPFVRTVVEVPSVSNELKRTVGIMCVFTVQNADYLERVLWERIEAKAPEKGVTPEELSKHPFDTNAVLWRMFNNRDKSNDRDDAAYENNQVVVV